MLSATVTKYLPSDWLDEIVPTPQENVNLFIHRDARGWFLYPADEDLSEGDDEDREPWLMRIQEGQRINFEAMRDYGDFQLTIADDGSFSTDRAIPDDANCFRHDREIDTLSDSLPELIKTAEMEPGIYDIDAYCWSDLEYAYRFEVVDGQGRLVAEGVVQ